MKNVLVTGGTGFIGSNLAIALLREGCRVRILRRSTSDLRAIGAADVEHVFGDVRDLSAVTSAVKGCDTVFHTAAIVSYWRRERHEMMDVNVRGTKNVVEACMELGVQKLVHTSSIAAIGFEPSGRLADESTQFNWEPYDVGYRISKRAAEIEIGRGTKHGLQAVIVNPSVVIGPRDIHFHGGQIVRDVFKKRLFYYPEGGTNIVYVDDVVCGHIQAAKVGRVGERYILAGENLTHQQVISATSDVVRGWGAWFSLPSPLVKVIAASAERIGDLMNSRPWISMDLVAGIHHNVWFNHAKAAKEFGFRPVPFRDAVERTFHWYRENDFL